MVRGGGNDLSSNTPRLSDADWQKLSDCLWEAGEDDCHYRSLYTPCPAPELEEDASMLEHITAEVLAAHAGEAPQTRVGRFRRFGPTC